jgi:AcrR family transcriptional regulator
VRVARDVFGEIGYEAATFQAIAVRADLTRPAINHHFADKRALYREVVDQTNNLVLANTIARAQNETTFVGRLTAFLQASVALDAEDRSVGAFFVTSVLDARRYPELQLIDEESLVNSREFLAWLVSDAIECGEISTDTDVSALVEVLSAVLWGAGFYASYLGNGHDLEAVMSNLSLLLSNKLWRFGE